MSKKKDGKIFEMKDDDESIKKKGTIPLVIKDYEAY